MPLYFGCDELQAYNANTCTTVLVDVRGERLRFLVSESPANTNPSSQAPTPLRPSIVVQVMPHVSDQTVFRCDLYCAPG